MEQTYSLQSVRNDIGEVAVIIRAPYTLKEKLINCSVHLFEIKSWQLIAEAQYNSENDALSEKLKNPEKLLLCKEAIEKTDGLQLQTQEGLTRLLKKIEGEKKVLNV